MIQCIAKILATIATSYWIGHVLYMFNTSYWNIGKVIAIATPLEYSHSEGN